MKLIYFAVPFTVSVIALPRDNGEWMPPPKDAGKYFTSNQPG
jgi:hypothetical protein